MSKTACRLSPLPSLGAISVTGADAADFLAAQLSQAPPSAGAQRAPLAAWHDAKGRVQALFRVVCRHDGFVLITHGSVVDDVTASLRRYILRSEVAVDALTDFACSALVGDSTSWLIDHGVVLEEERWTSATKDEVAWLRLGPALVHAVGTTDRIGELAHALPSGSAAQAELEEIRLGIPVITAELGGQFLPQMLNLDVLDAVAFDKGCYPGQEIIARAQNLGSVKRRLLRFAGETDVAPSASSPLLDQQGRTAGVVVRSAPSPSGIELLAVTRLEASSQTLTCADETVLRLEDLPYTVPGMEP